MRILWLAIDHSNRVMDLFTPFREAVARQGVEVEFRVKSLGERAGLVCRRLWGAQVKPEPFPPMIDDPRETDEFDFVMCDTAWLFHNEPWDGVKCPVGVSWGDNHGSMVPMYLDASRRFVTHYFPMLWESWEVFHADRFTDKVAHWMPWSFNPEMFRDYRRVKNIEVLSTGVLAQNVYRIRTRADKACQGLQGYRRVDRPSEDIPGSWPRGADYAKLLNSARMCLSCSGAWHYALGKTFEIPAARSVLVSDCCTDALGLGHVPGETMLEVTADMDLETVRAQIGTWLADPDLLARVALNGYTLMHSHHTNDIRAAEFVEHLRNHVI